MKKIFLLLVVTLLVLVSCNEKGHGVNEIPCLPEVGKELVKKVEPVKVDSSTEFHKVKLHNQELLLLDNGTVLTSFDFSKFGDFTNMEVRIVSVTDVLEAYKWSQSQVRNRDNILFANKEVSNMFVEKDQLYIRNEISAYKFEIKQEINFLMVIKKTEYFKFIHFFALKNSVWKY